MLTHTSCLNENEMLQGDHACITSHMQIKFEIQHSHAQKILATNLPCIHHMHDLIILAKPTMHPPYQVFKNACLR